MSKPRNTKPGRVNLERSLWPLALMAGFWPILVVHAALLVSVVLGPLEWRYPMIDGAYSVSAVARQEPTLYWFRIAIMPYALLLAWFWFCQGAWLHQNAQTPPRRAAMVAVTGALGAVFMVLYASFLGTDGEVYNWLRRFGATLLFALTALAQLLCVPALQRFERDMDYCRPARLARWLAASMVLIGLASLGLPALLDDPNAWQNRVEWWFGALMMLWFVAVAACWRRSGLCFSLTNRPAPRRR